MVEDMEGMELLNFQIISNVGDAKSSLFEALKVAREEKFEAAAMLIEKADESLGKAQEIHLQLLGQEAQDTPLEVSLLLMHAEDQMMTTEMLKYMAKEMVLIHQKYSK